MRKAMAEAEVGDDVFGEDPTVQCPPEKGGQDPREERQASLFPPGQWPTSYRSIPYTTGRRRADHRSHLPPL